MSACCGLTPLTMPWIAFCSTGVPEVNDTCTKATSGLPATTLKRSNTNFQMASAVGVQARSTLTLNLKPASGLKTITSSRKGLQILGPAGTTLVLDLGISCE